MRAFQGRQPMKYSDSGEKAAVNAIARPEGYVSAFDDRLAAHQQFSCPLLAIVRVF